MKPINLILAAIILLQSCAKKIEAVEARVGVGHAGITGGSFNDPLGAQVSVETKFLEIDQHSSLMAGLGVSFQGATYTDVDVDGKVQLTYLNLPILYNYESKKGFYAELGLQPGITISAKDKYLGETHDYKDQVKSFELGLPAGVGYHFKNGIGVGVRVVYGLTNLDNSTNPENLHNILAMAMLSYRFHKKK